MIEKKSENTKEAQSDKSDRSFKAGAQKRILIVDDDNALAQLLHSFFVKAGFECQFAIKGKEGLDLYKELRPHLVLLDLLLPDLMGFEVLKRMRESNWSENVAFVIISGIMKDPQTKQKALTDFKANAFIEKPFHVREMHNVILKHLGMDQIKEEKAEANASNKKAPTVPEPEVTIEGGDLGTIDLPRLLSAFFTAKVTGVLKVGSGEIVKAIFFEDGKPIFAASKDPRDRLGEIILRNGYLSKDQIENALKNSEGENRIGTILIQTGLLTANQLYNLIQLQVREIILSTFSWKEGRYSFNFEDLAGKEMIKLQTPTADLVIEGIRRHYDLNRLIGILVSKDRILKKNENPHFAFQDLHLGTSENRIYNFINGRRTIQKISQDSKLPEENVLQLIYGLLVMKIIEDKN